MSEWQRCGPRSGQDSPGPSAAVIILAGADGKRP